MTLVIVGHTYEQDLVYPWDSSKERAVAPTMHVSGLFVAADSVLTVHGSTGLQPVMDSFRKAYPISIKVWMPYFVGGYFHSYQNIHFESVCFVAFSGSSLVAQHAINTITTHLGELRITMNSEGKYTVVRDCEKNSLKSASYSTFWDDDTFLPSDLDSILTADDLATHVEHSINVAFKSAKKYKTSMSTVEAMRTDFAFGVQCPTTRDYKLYVFRMEYYFTIDGIVVNTRIEFVPAGKVAVLGMRQRFEQGAQNAFSAALKKGDSPESEVFNFINGAIDQVSASGSFEIARPSSLKTLKDRAFSLRYHKSG